MKRLFCLLLAGSIASAPAASAEFCFKEDDKWLETAKSGEPGYWAFKPSPSALAPSPIPIVCFQRDIRFEASGQVVFPEGESPSRNKLKCNNQIEDTSFSWEAQYSQVYQDWGVVMTSKSGQSLFMFASCELSGGYPSLLLSAEVIHGKVGAIRYTWRSDRDE